MKRFLTVIQYLVVFVAIQVVTTMAVVFAWLMIEGDTARIALQNSLSGKIVTDGTALLLISVISSLLTILLFMVARWSPFSRDYIRTRPWSLLFWVAILACGTVIPSEWLLEKIGLDMPIETQQLFEQIIRHPAGYLVVGILVPLAEEMVFRGAILRTLLKIFDRRWHWLPIVLSALLFGAVHANLAQFVHATLLGLLLGWLYYRSGSIVPGLVLHCTNNTIAYVLTRLLPQSANASLAELLGGEQKVWFALACSLCIFLPALYQVAVRSKGVRE